MADRKVGDMTIDELRSATGSGPGATTGGATKPAIMDTSLVDKTGKAISGLAEAALPAAFGLNKLMTGADAATSAVSGLTKGLSTVGLGSLAGVVGTVAKAFIDQKTNMDAASKELGIGGNNLGTFIRMSGEAGLTTKEFTDTIKKTDGLMSGLAGSSQRGAEAFSKVQKSLIESKVGEELNAIGISGKELADMTALSMSNNTKLNLKTAEGQKEAAAAAGQLATELDATSKITGQSREALAKTLEAEEKKPNVILMEMQMTKEQLEGYKSLKTQMAGFGPSFQSLSAEIASGGVRTKEGLAQMAALGPAGTQLQSATQQMINAKTDEQKAAAKAALDRAQAAVNERMGSAEYQKMYAFGTAEQKAAIDKQVQGYEGLGAAQKAAREANGDYAAGLKNQKAEAAAVQKGQKVDADGKPITDSKGAAVMDEGAKTAQALNMANRQATIMAGGMAQQLEKTNASLGKSPAAIEAFNNSLKYVGSAKTMEQGRDQIAKLPANALKAAGGGETDKVEAPASGGSGGAQGRKPTAVTPTNPVPAHAEGGVIQGPELAVIAEKGPEAVIPLDKLKDVIGNVSSTISSATGSPKASAGAGVSAPVDDKSKELWIKNFQSTQDFKAAAEKESANADKESITARLADRQSKVEALQKLSTERELTEKEKGDLTLAQFGVRRATNSLKDNEARFAAIEAMEKQGSAKLVDSKKAEVAEVAKLTAEISSGGVRTAEGLKTMAAMGVDGIKLQKQVEESTAKVKEKSVGGGGGLFDMMNPKIINQKAADLEKAETAKTAPKTSDVAPKNAEEEAKKKQEAEKAKADADAKAKPATATAKDATLKDLNDQLIALNKHMVQLINHSESTADAAHKTAKSTAKAQGARG